MAFLPFLSRQYQPPPQPTPTTIYPRARPQPLPSYSDDLLSDYDDEPPYIHPPPPPPEEIDINELRWIPDFAFPYKVPGALEVDPFRFESPPTQQRPGPNWNRFDMNFNPNQESVRKPMWLNDPNVNQKKFKNKKLQKDVPLYDPVILDIPKNYAFPLTTIDYALYYVYQSLTEVLSQFPPDPLKKWQLPTQPKLLMYIWNLEIAYNCLIDVKKQHPEVGAPFWEGKRGWNDGQYIEDYVVPQDAFPIDLNPHKEDLIRYFDQLSEYPGLHDPNIANIWNIQGLEGFINKEPSAWVELKTGIPFIKWPSIAGLNISYFGTPNYSYDWPTTALDHALYALHEILMDFIGSYPNDRAFGKKKNVFLHTHAWNAQIAYNCCVDLKKGAYNLGSPLNHHCLRRLWNDGFYIENYKIPPDYIIQESPVQDWVGDNLLRGNKPYENLPPEWRPR